MTAKMSRRPMAPTQTPMSQKMSEVDWRLLRKIISLPDEARSDIDDCFSHYRRMKAFTETGELTNYELKKSLLRISKIAQAFVTEITELGSPEYFWLNDCRGHYVYAKTEEEFSDAVWKLSSDARMVAEWLAYAAGRASERKSLWLKTNWVERLIVSLDQRLDKHTGVRAKRGAKAPAQFIRAACKIADPALGPGTIEEAFKLVAKRNRNLAKSGIKKNSNSAKQF